MSDDLFVNFLENLVSPFEDVFCTRGSSDGTFRSRGRLDSCQPVGRQELHSGKIMSAGKKLYT